MSVAALKGTGRSLLGVSLLDSAARTTSSNSVAEVGSEIKHLADFIGATILLDVTTASGTSPTLNVYIQKLLPDDTTWQDIASFVQMTTTGKEYADLVHMDASVIATNADGALTADNTQVGLFGNEWRLKWVIGGTNPSFTFTVSGSFFK